MKSRIQPPLRNLLMVSSLLAVSVPAFALKDDTSQPIHIDSAQQALDMEGNTVTFTGNVVAKQGSIEIKADKVVVIRPQGQQGKEVIEAYGNPVTFFQLQENGKPVKGHSQKMRYELANDFVTLTGNAYLEQLDSNVKGDRITYLVQKQQMEAFSDEGKRVTTVLIPTQLQDKGNTSGTQKKSN
ncbi:lipopolysaccharide ABC transporter substrate-binding protein LptA [Chimaeribacter arupi]|uniref:Lipopolysaccharide export system protein LptA n=2 Tax=Yersiniaceae TaxID=1903411 RepID=A0A2N5ES65_9GAMM|nr:MULTISPECIES: lipopolysaccharide ABC transporter substrate-binding protein LptA [Yersiniaceae]MBS0970475.1 lipopolysaccharide ABC transporter substrate-binding protein LptA [Nissabacter archeti]MDV5138594.1 lipopolysaccharide ABC transporter substrate-binding protein LptA [Chimaeribacter arupi]PLR37763.1 lipopolysaccharide ABC transporter substrate-binding protein LptA [Chimaeribacter arupi]PLR47762.1 lipopolysaccharide ABC transporter substrate-binding protein LptA [Chimaeribacter arupi]PL